MKLKKVHIVLISVFCSLAVVAGAITATVFIVRNNRQREIEQRIENCKRVLYEEIPEELISTFDLNMQAYAFVTSGKDADAIKEIDRKTALMGLDFFISADDGNPFMRAKLSSGSKEQASVYLYNGNIYSCVYESDSFASRFERIEEIISVEDVFGGPVGLPSGDLSDAEIEKLFEMLNISDAEDLETFKKLIEAPESAFTDALTEQKDGQTRYIFYLDTDYFDSYFDSLEEQISEEFVARFGKKEAYICAIPENHGYRITAMLREVFGRGSRTFNFAVDIKLEFGADKPYIAGDVLVADKYLDGEYEECIIDCGNEPLPRPEGIQPNETSPCNYFVVDLSDRNAKGKLIYTSNGLIVHYDKDKVYVYNVHGQRVRVIDYRYEVVSVVAYENYLTVVLYQPEVNYTQKYLFKDFDTVRCITYDVTDFSRVSTVELKDAGAPSLVLLCGNKLIVYGERRCWFVNVPDGAYVVNDDFYELNDRQYYNWYYNEEENKLWLWDLYLGKIIVDLDDCTYTFTDELPKKDTYKPAVIPSGEYKSVNTFAEWNGYDLAFATNKEYNARHFLVIYDRTTQSIAGSTEIKYENIYNYLITEDGKLIWWNDKVVGVADLPSLLG